VTVRGSEADHLRRARKRQLCARRRRWLDGASTSDWCPEETFGTLRVGNQRSGLESHVLIGKRAGKDLVDWEIVGATGEQAGRSEETSEAKGNLGDPCTPATALPRLARAFWTTQR
jgi:hypothetical protein